MTSLRFHNTSKSLRSFIHSIQHIQAIIYPRQSSSFRWKTSTSKSPPTTMQPRSRSLNSQGGHGLKLTTAAIALMGHCLPSISLPVLSCLCYVCQCLLLGVPLQVQHPRSRSSISSIPHFTFGAAAPEWPLNMVLFAAPPSRVSSINGQRIPSHKRLACHSDAPCSTGPQSGQCSDLQARRQLG